jgi:hypothetical protein
MNPVEEFEENKKMYRFVEKYELLLHINDAVRQLAALLADQGFAQAIAETLSDDPIGQLQRHFDGNILTDDITKTLSDNLIRQLQQYFDDNIIIENVSDDDIISVFRITSQMIIDFFYKIDAVAENIPIKSSVNLKTKETPRYDKENFRGHWHSYKQKNHWLSAYLPSYTCTAYEFGTDDNLADECETLCKRFKAYLNYLYDWKRCIDKDMVARYGNFIDIMLTLVNNFPLAWQQLFCIEKTYGIKNFQPFWFDLPQYMVEHVLMRMIEDYKFPEFIKPMLVNERLSMFLLATDRVYKTCKGAFYHSAIHRRAIQEIMDTNVVNPEKLGQALALLINITVQSMKFYVYSSWSIDTKDKIAKIEKYETEAETCFRELFRIKDQESQLDMWMCILSLVKHYLNVISRARDEKPFFNDRMKTEQPKFYAEVQALVDSREIRHFPIPIDFQRDCFSWMLASSNPVATIKSVLFLNTLHLSNITRYKEKILSYSEPWLIIKLLLLIDYVSNYEDNARLFKDFLHNEPTVNHWLKLISAEPSTEKQDKMMWEVAKNIYTQWIMLEESKKSSSQLIR